MESKQITDENFKEYTEDEKRKAAYALNMCTVSVAQIIDYNDAYVLEQEYDAILNNLNLEQIPDDDAFLHILTELLNTITFFRIQEKEKSLLDKQYQKRMKNAIWSAVPNIGFIIADGNPVNMLFSLAIQIGSGYMNYRREKSNIVSEKEKEELELEIAAIEQFNAMRRELFTTAWRIAKEYKFPDAYRLTEKQIRQYNQILMDEDDERRFIRLEAIKENFVAYPPYWYYMGHAAAYLAGMNRYKIARNDPDEARTYVFSEEEKYHLEKAKEYFNEYYIMNKYNILREDQITASFALEYVDILMLEEERDTAKIGELLRTAKSMSGCAYDVMQLCAVSYLQIGELSEAAVILKQLVNEEYNVVTNAKLLSRIYVSQYLRKEEPSYICGNKKSTYDARLEYKLLTNRVNEVYLFRMPTCIESDMIKQDKELQAEYVDKQRKLLVVAYRKAIVELEYHMAVKFNQILFPGTAYQEGYFESTKAAKEKRRTDVEKILNSNDRIDYIAELENIGFRFRISDCLNQTVNIFDTLSLFRKSDKKEALIRLIRKNFIAVIPLLNATQDKLASGSFEMEDYRELQENVSYDRLTGEFFDKVRKVFFGKLEQEERLSDIEEAESELISLCEREHLQKPEIEKKIVIHKELADTVYFGYEIFGNDANTEADRQKKYTEMKLLVENAVNSFSGGDEKKIKFIIRKDIDFESYFSNTAFHGGLLKPKTIAILDDRTYINDDILFTTDGLVIVSKNEIKGTFPYDNVSYENDSHGNEKLIIGKTYEFSNGIFNLGVDIKALKKLIDDMNKIK